MFLSINVTLFRPRQTLSNLVVHLLFDYILIVSVSVLYNAVTVCFAHNNEAVNIKLQEVWASL